MMKRAHILLVVLITVVFFSGAAQASTLTFGDMDCLGQSCYGSADPTTGATLQGLAPNTITLASRSFGHGFPFAPSSGDFPGTDTIFVGTTQTASHDGYSASGRVNGPQVFSLDYSSLIGPGQSLSTLTLGIGADDFQYTVFGQPFTASINGSVNAALTAQLNALNQTGPVVQFFTIGLNPTIDTGNHILTLSINEGGDGGDGWAVDYLTIGATTTSSVPIPGAILLFAPGLVGLVAVRRQFKN